MPSSVATPVTTSVTRHVDPSRTNEMLAWVQAGTSLAERFDGFLGSGWVRPSEESPDWHMLYRFASADALDAIKLKPARVCPLICAFGFKRDGDRCVKIACAAGHFVNDDNECEKLDGGALCPECLDVCTYQLKCPGCEAKACRRCQKAASLRFPHNRGKMARTELMMGRGY